MRQPNIIRSIKLTTALPEDLKTKLDLFLYSELEGRIPKGAHQRFFVERIQDFFNTQSLDLSPYCRLPTSASVRGSSASISLLTELLRGTLYDQS